MRNNPAGKSGYGISVREMTLFAMFSALMYATKIAMQVLPNIHLLAMFVILLTVNYRVKALIPIYLYVLIEGIFAGFSLWWVPYLYIWTVLWAVIMLLPKNLSDKAGMIVYPIMGALHGISFGTLYAPVQALMSGLDMRGMIAWIAAGFPFDCIHAAGNFFFCMLVVPLSRLLRKIGRTGSRHV